MEQLTKVTHRQFLKIYRDYAKAATLADLVYVSDTQPGIGRYKKGRGYMYMFEGKPLHKKEDIKRIRSLAIPPSWTSVWICALPNGHIQATGLDMRKRKQYRYHPLWSVLRNETKFHRLYEFGKALPVLRSRLEIDLSQKNLTATKVIATVVSNTRTVCKKYYVHPGLIALYEENNLNKYLAGLDELEKPDEKTGLHTDEQILMKILQSFHKN